MRLSERGKKSREMEGVMKNKKQEECVFKAALRQRTCHCNELLGWQWYVILLIIKLLCSHLPKYLFFGEEGVCQTAEKCCYRQTSEKPTIVLFCLGRCG